MHKVEIPIPKLTEEEKQAIWQRDKPLQELQKINEREQKDYEKKKSFFENKIAALNEKFREWEAEVKKLRANQKIALNYIAQYKTRSKNVSRKRLNFTSLRVRKRRDELIALEIKRRMLKEQERVVSEAVKVNKG